MVKRNIGKHFLLAAAFGISTLMLQQKAWAINVPLIVQEQSNWCWAATGQMIGAFFGVQRPLQCLQAANAFNKDCCGDEASCNAYGSSAYSLIWWGLHYTDTGYYSMTLAQVKHEVASSRPWSHLIGICYNADCTQYWAHELTGTGGYQAGGTYYVKISDPEGYTYTETYDAYYNYDPWYYAEGWNDLYGIHW